MQLAILLLMSLIGKAAMGETTLDTAVLGGGCFWCMEAIFQQVIGVEEVLPGYAGGFVENPTYEQVCSDTTGHAEVVRIVFDPAKISYEMLLKIFWTVHDPTTPNRQGNDVGSQYRSIILYRTPQQRAIAERLRETFAASLWEKPIVTEIKPLDKFYPAEEYHRNYFARHPEQAYCQLVIQPKVQKFREKFQHLLKTVR